MVTKPQKGIASSSSSNILFSEILAIQRAITLGCKYGIKIRFPHAFVMTYLFRRGLSLREKMRLVTKLTASHALNLSMFAGVYKATLFFLKIYGRKIGMSAQARSSSGYVLKFISWLVGGSTTSTTRHIPRAPGIPEEPYHAIIAGAIGGYTIWGKDSAVNYQIVLYLASRVIVGCMGLAREKGIQPFSCSKLHFRNAFPLFSAAIWSAVMFLFEEHPHVLHPSLKKSMDDIYR